MARIVTAEGDLAQAFAGQSITLTLEDELDISRGDVISAAATPAETADQFETTLVWLGDEPMLPGRSYLFKAGTRTVGATNTSGVATYSGNISASTNVTLSASNNGGTTWVTMASYTTTASWTTRTLNVGDFVTLTNNMRFRFEAADTGTDNSLVCGIDNFTINTINCGIEGDLDGDGAVGGGDLSILLLDFGPCAGSPCPSDLDGNGTVDSGDIAFLLLLFT